MIYAWGRWNKRQKKLATTKANPTPSGLHKRYQKQWKDVNTEQGQRMLSEEMERKGQTDAAYKKWKIWAFFMFWGCVHAYFAKAESAFWNDDSKRRSKTPLIQAIVRAQVNRKGVYMTSFKRGYNVILRSCFHQNQRFALTTFVNAHFWAFWIGVLKRVYSKISMDATAFCSNHVWKRWFWPQKLSINAPRFESAFWNAFIRK